MTFFLFHVDLNALSNTCSRQCRITHLCGTQSQSRPNQSRLLRIPGSSIGSSIGHLITLSSVVFYLGAAPPLGVCVLFPRCRFPSSDSYCFMKSIRVQGALSVRRMRAVAECDYEADAPVLDGRGGLSSPTGWLVSNLCRLARCLHDLMFLFLFLAALSMVS